MSRFFYRHYDRAGTVQNKNNWSDFNKWCEKMKDDIGHSCVLSEYERFGCKLRPLKYAPLLRPIEHHFIVLNFHDNQDGGLFLCLERYQNGIVACLSKDKERVKRNSSYETRPGTYEIDNGMLQPFVKDFFDRLSLEKDNMNPVYSLLRRNCQHFSQHVKNCINYNSNQFPVFKPLTAHSDTIDMLDYYDLDFAKNIFKHFENKDVMHIVGPSGSGKTYLAYYTMKRKAEKGEPALYIDILRKSYYSKGTFNYTDAKDHISVMIIEELKYDVNKQQNPFDQLIEYLKQSPIYLILDGIDHVLECSDEFSNLFDIKFGLRNCLTLSRKKLTNEGYYELKGYSPERAKSRMKQMAELIADKDDKSELKKALSEVQTRIAHKLYNNIEVLHNVIFDAKRLLMAKRKRRGKEVWTESEKNYVKVYSEYISVLSSRENNESHTPEDIYQSKYRDLAIEYQVLIQLVALMTLSWKEISVQKIQTFFEHCNNYFINFRLQNYIIVEGLILLDRLLLIRKNIKEDENDHEYSVKSTLCWSLLDANNDEYGNFILDRLRVGFVYYCFLEVIRYDLDSYKGIKYDELMNQAKQAILMSTRKTKFSSINLEKEELRGILRNIIDGGGTVFFNNLKQLFSCSYENYYQLFIRYAKKNFRFVQRYLQKLKSQDLSHNKDTVDCRKPHDQDASKISMFLNATNKDVEVENSDESRIFTLHNIIETIARPNLLSFLHQALQNFSRSNDIPTEVFKRKELKKQLHKLLNHYELCEVYPICNICKCKKHINLFEHFFKCKDCKTERELCCCDLHTDTNEYGIELLCKLIPVVVKGCKNEKSHQEYISDIRHLLKELRHTSQRQLQRESLADWQKRKHHYEAISKGELPKTLDLRNDGVLFKGRRNAIIELSTIFPEQID